MADNTESAAVKKRLAAYLPTQEAPLVLKGITAVRATMSADKPTTQSQKQLKTDSLALNFIARILLWAFVVSCGSPLPAQSDTVIVNDTVWKDTDGNEVVAGFGGHITKVGDTYYWVGTDPRPTDGSVRLYSSKTLGSNSWKLETVVEKRKSRLGRRNCTLVHCPTTDRFVIVSKGIGFYQSKGSDVKGPYTYVKKIGAEQLRKQELPLRRHVGLHRRRQGVFDHFDAAAG